MSTRTRVCRTDRCAAASGGCQESTLAGTMPALVPGCLLHQVAYDTADAICVLDEDLRFVAFNPAYAEIVHRAFGTRIRIGMAITHGLVRDGEPHLQFITGWRNAVDGHELRAVHPIVDADGCGRAYSVYLRPITLPDGRKGAAGVLRDVSEPVKAWTQTLQAALEAIQRQHRLLQEKEALLEEALRASQQRGEAKSRLIAILGHELRTPITSIIGYANSLESGVAGEVSEKGRTFAHRIGAAGWHLAQVVEDVLLYTRNAAGRERYEPKPIDFRDVASDVVQIMESAAREKGLDLTAKLPTEPVHGVSDPVKVRQILLNLLGNAVKFTPAGAISLEMTVDQARGSVDLAVHDSGPGIAGEDVSRIFEPFVQAEPVNTRKVGGTGLGLTIAEQLATLLGGGITVSSALGTGSTFTVTLPLRAPSPPETPERIMAG